MTRTRDPSPRLVEATTRLDRLHNWEGGPRRRMRQDLRPVRALLESLGNPHHRFRSVHVAGTKGKGSVASMVAEGLRLTGSRVGVYASPHVERINERVRIHGGDVEDDALAQLLDHSLDALEKNSSGEGVTADATWFDTLTAAAFLGFAEEGCDWVVVECGLGGRLDSTNVLLPELCVLTGVELEHTEILGDTRAAIAGEKAGILKPGVPLVTSLPESDEAGAVVAERCADLGLRVHRPPVSVWEAAGIGERNLLLADLALQALEAEGAFGARERPLATALAGGAALPGRLEVFHPSGPPVVLDGAHVPSSVDAVLRELSGHADLSGMPHVVLALALDKDQEGILKALAGHVDSVTCTSIGTPAFREPAAVHAGAVEEGLTAETAGTPIEALQRARKRAASTGGWVLAIGSLYLAGALRPHLVASETRPPCSPSSPTCSSRTHS